MEDAADISTWHDLPGPQISTWQLKLIIAIHMIHIRMSKKLTLS